MYVDMHTSESDCANFAVLQYTDDTLYIYIPVQF